MEIGKSIRTKVIIKNRYPELIGVLEGFDNNYYYVSYRTDKSLVVEKFTKEQIVIMK